MKFLFILFLSAITPEIKTPGHMEPFPEDKLSKPIYLTDRCSNVSIEEWSNKSKPDIKKLSKLCNVAVNNFEKQGKLFRWQLSFLPDGYCYRCLNDIEYRFIERSSRHYIDAYTTQTYRYSFLPNDLKNKKFDLYFIHELYHALSMFYGIYDKDNEEKAWAFTRNLGLGE